MKKISTLMGIILFFSNGKAVNPVPEDKKNLHQTIQVLTAKNQDLNSEVQRLRGMVRDITLSG